ncbi:MAG: formylglycine-generating enzyme family protein [Nodosilinea sp.]
MALTLRRTPRTAQGFVEPLLAVGEALPLHMVLVPGGIFLMGSPDDEPEREEREGPQHKVTVLPFFIGRYSVTQSQWRVVAAMPQVERELKTDPSSFKGDNRPVEQVSWYDAEEFCARLSAHTNRQYRLPSEAEWEYACRAGTTTPFYFGNTLTTEVANYNGNYTYADGSKGEYREETTPVDHFGIANAFGLCDMHGNVWEWCQDHWHDNHEGAPTDGSAWIEGGDSDGRILRGGSWYSNPRYCRSAYRGNFEPVNRYINIGFRVVCSAPMALQRPTS